MRLRFAVPMLLLLLLCACGAESIGAQQPVDLRTSLASAGACSYKLELRASYGDYYRDFTLACHGNGKETSFSVLLPEAAEGITGTVSGSEAAVSYGDTVLAVEDFSSRHLSPMAAPYLLNYAFESGYIAAVGQDGDYLQVDYTLGYGSRSLTARVLFDGVTPVSAELSDGESVLISCVISDFQIIKKEVNQNDGTETNLGGDRSG